MKLTSILATIGYVFTSAHSDEYATHGDFNKRLAKLQELYEEMGGTIYGAPGYTGPIGPTGYDGEPGDVNYLPGPRGQPGIAGTPGRRGGTGGPGQKGSTGETGAVGEPGRNGNLGKCLWFDC